MQNNIGWNLDLPSKPSCPSPTRYSWQPWSIGETISMDTIEGGTDVDNSKIYVGRAFHNGDLLPAKVIPSKSAIYVPYAGREINLQSCELLVKEFGSFDWVRDADGSVPCTAISVGKTLNGEPLFTGRTEHAGGLIVGKIHPSHSCCYIPFGGKEHGYRTYEVLCTKT